MTRAKRIAQDTPWNDIRQLLLDGKTFSDFRFGKLTIKKVATAEYQIWQGENFVQECWSVDDVAYYLANNR